MIGRRLPEVIEGAHVDERSGEPAPGPTQALCAGDDAGLAGIGEDDGSCPPEGRDLAGAHETLAEDEPGVAQRVLGIPAVAAEMDDGGVRCRGEETVAVVAPIGGRPLS
jgi:hypothetical protein